MPLRYLWKGSPCRGPVRRTLCHARMPLRHLLAGSPCQSADRSPLRHAGMALRYLWKGSPCRGPTGIEERNRFEVAWKMLRHAGILQNHLLPGVPCLTRSQNRHNPCNGTDFLPFGTRPCPRSASVEGPRAKVLIEALFATRPCLRTTCSRGCRAKPGRKLDHKPCNGTDSLPLGTRPCPRSASVEGPRAKVLIEALFATR